VVNFLAYTNYMSNAIRTVLFGRITHFLGLFVGLTFFVSPNIEPGPWLADDSLSAFSDDERNILIRYYPSILRHAKVEGVSPSLVMAVIHQESAFNPGVVSHKGAIGLMQLMPVTAWNLYSQNGGQVATARLQRHLITQPDLNIGLGVRALAQIQGIMDPIRDQRMKNALTLSSYNAGLQRVKKAFYCKTMECLTYKSNHYGKGYFSKALRRLPAETRDYLKRVTRLEKDYKSGLMASAN